MSTSGRPSNSPDGVGNSISSARSSPGAAERMSEPGAKFMSLSLASFSLGDRSRSLPRSSSALPMIVLGGRLEVEPISASLSRMESDRLMDSSSSSDRTSAGSSSASAATVGSSISSRLRSLGGLASCSSSSSARSRSRPLAGGSRCGSGLLRRGGIFGGSFGLVEIV